MLKYLLFIVKNDWSKACHFFIILWEWINHALKNPVSLLFKHLTLHFMNQGRTSIGFSFTLLTSLDRWNQLKFIWTHQNQISSSLLGLQWILPWDNDTLNKVPLVHHGGDASGAGAMLPGQEVTWSDMEVDSIRIWFPTGEFLAHCCPGYSALPGVRARIGLRWHCYGPYTSMKNFS